MNKNIKYNHQLLKEQNKKNNQTDQCYHFTEEQNKN